MDEDTHGLSEENGSHTPNEDSSNVNESHVVLTADNVSTTTNSESSSVNGLNSVSISSSTQSCYDGYSFGYACPVEYVGDGTLTYSATGLPSGFSIDSQNGLITGTPTALFNKATVTVTVTDGNVSDSTTFNIVRDLKVSITGIPLGATEGVPYQFVPLIQYASPQYSFTGVTLIDGTLPPCCKLDPARGVVYGTPAVAGTYTFTLQITDGVHTNTNEFTINVAKPNG